MRHLHFGKLFFVVFSLLLACTVSARKPIKTLLITGQNNHNWQVSHVVLKQILENSGRFDVDFAISPEQGKDMSGFVLDFSPYQLVVLDYNGDSWPEETNRRIVDIISDVNLCYSEHARRYLMECGMPKERTFVVGSPMAEVLRASLEKIKASDVHARLGLTRGRYILLSAHREENIDTDCNFIQLFTAVNAMAETYNMPILYSCHPRSRKRLEATGFPLDRRVIAHEPLGFHDYNCLQMNAFAVVSDSGTLPEESSFFLSAGRPFPAVSIRTSTERPEALDAGCFVLAGIDADSLLRAVDMAVSMQAEGRFGTPVTDYTGENVSTKVARIIQSYTGIVNRLVWRKDG